MISGGRYLPAASFFDYNTDCGKKGRKPPFFGMAGRMMAKQHRNSVTKNTERHDGPSGLTQKTGKVLILSAPIGSVHRMASQALAEALAEDPRLCVEQGDVFRFFPQWTGRLALGVYGWVLRHCPSLYAASYRWGNGGGSLWVRNALNALLCRLGKAYLDREAPDIVVSTHATPTGIVSRYKRLWYPELRLAVVVTDFTVHQWLVCPGVDTYYVAAPELAERVRELAARNGLASPRVLVTGIPLRKAFARPYSEAERTVLRHHYGWQDGDFVCLAAGGGDGLLPMEELCAVLNRPGLESLRIVAVTGRNGRLRRRLDGLARTAYGGRLTVLGFRDDMADLFTACDAVVSKAGGVSAAETLACGAPLLIYRPLPGQEGRNAAFLTSRCGARTAADTEALADLLRSDIAKGAAQRAGERAALRRRCGHGDAASLVARDVIYM